MHIMNRYIFALMAILNLIAIQTQATTDNLISDPSFEKTQDRDKFGKVFSGWGGWIYERPARFEVGTLSHSGEHSCLMVGENGGKIRIFTEKRAYPAGRYRLTAHLRGLDIGKGLWGKSVELAVDLDNKWFNLKKSGTFGWTPVTYVFDIAKEKSETGFHLYVGLFGNGRLWVDDMSLVRVDESVKLTAEPVCGEEESPIVPPGSFPERTVRCSNCAYRNDPAWKECYACGTDLGKSAEREYSSPPEFVFADFEDGTISPFAEGVLEVDNPIGGTASLRVEKGYSATISHQDWSEHDYVHFDTFNPHDDPVQVYVEVRDSATRGYWTRVNYMTVMPPGKGTVTFPTVQYVGEKSRPGRPLIRSEITRFVVSIGNNGPIVFDNFRLERLDTASMAIPEIIAFDFGKSDSPLMDGFARGDTQPYSEGRGYGWIDAKIWRSMNVLQPEALTADFVCPDSGIFRVDLPNGKYHVVMNVDCAGGYWGEVQKFKSREVFANGKTVLSEKLDFETFRKRYYRNASREDLPGLDTFAEYIEPMFNELIFDVDVADGKIELDFKGNNWALTLTHLIIYPDEKSQEGEKFLQWVTDRRRSQFNNYFKQVIPRKKGAEPPRNGYRIFSRYFMTPVEPYDGPVDAEEEPLNLSVTLAKGEEHPVTFSIQPSDDLGEIDIEISDLCTFDGKSLEEGSVIPGWIDYRINRITMEGTVYSVGPRYWHPTPAPSTPNVTRRFWLRIKPPETTMPGIYTGHLTVSPKKGNKKKLPVSVRVLPFTLDPITDVPVGPWGASIHIDWYGDNEKKAWDWQMFENSLDVLKAAGCTSFSGPPSLKVKTGGGKFSLDTELADRQMKHIRSKGFNHLISSYGNRYLGYDLYSGPTRAEAENAGFDDTFSFLKTLYAAIDAHAISNNWLPVAWNLCDEPGAEAIDKTFKVAKLHREAGKGLKLTTFMGETSMTGNDVDDPHHKLLTTFPITALGIHDDESIGVIRDAGNRFCSYNGGDRWTYGAYLRMLVKDHNIAMRLDWHYNINAGDPYYALDCREDDYCWYNTNADGEMIPSLDMLRDTIPGLNDYRYLATLERLIDEKATLAKTIKRSLLRRISRRPDRKALLLDAVDRAQLVLHQMLDIKAGPDSRRQNERADEGRLAEFKRDREKIASAIEELVNLMP